MEGQGQNRVGKCIKRIRYGTIRTFERYYVTKGIDDAKNLYVDLHMHMQATCKLLHV